MSSPGSCLEEFRARPFIECRSQGTCNFFSTAVSYWLATVKEHEMFRKPQQQTLKTDHTSRVSRCSVCVRRHVRETNDQRITSHEQHRNQHRGHYDNQQQTIDNYGFRQPTVNFDGENESSNEIELGSRDNYLQHQRNQAVDYWRKNPNYQRSRAGNSYGRVTSLQEQQQHRRRHRRMHRRSEEVKG